MGNLESCCAYGSSSSSRRDGKVSRKQRGNGHHSSSGQGFDPRVEYGDGVRSSGVFNHPMGPLGGGGYNANPPRHEESIGNLQHISEREPDDWEEDPSLHPTTGTLFMEKSKQSIQSKNFTFIPLVLSSFLLFNAFPFDEKIKLPICFFLHQSDGSG